MVIMDNKEQKAGSSQRKPRQGMNSKVKKNLKGNGRNASE
jgi:hypothetical protein